MQRRIPSIDITPTPGSYSPLPYDHTPWYRSRRFIIFAVSFFLCMTISLSYVFSRPAIYQSSATLLTVAKTAIDQVSGDADIQHVAIQKQILLGSELLAETSRRLEMPGVKVTDIRRMLDVRGVEETNLVEMVAEGADANLLPALINTWIDVYLAARAAEITKLTGNTTQIIEDELSGLSEKINIKRIELGRFRQNHDISSVGREENEALARLSGLNVSLNVANEEAVKAKSRLDSINKAIDRGQSVVPHEDTRTLSLLEQRAQELREELEELDRRYTREYMELSPSLKVVPKKLAALESEIKQMRQSGQRIVLADAEQEYHAAQQTVLAIRNQLDEHKLTATEFTTRFTEHDALQSDLEALELLYRETQDRLVQIKTRYAGKYPQVDVIERAFLPSEPIRPNYWLDALIAVIGSILFGLFCVWISEFLTRKEQPKSAVNLSGIHLYQGDAPDVLGHPPHQNKLTQQQQYALERPTIREVSEQEIADLLRTANDKAKLLIALLLSGMTLEEVSALQDDDVDCDKDKLMVRGSSLRSIPLNQGVRSLFEDSGCRLTNPAGDSLMSDDLAALLACAVIDAGLSAPEEVNTASLRHTYMVYLVKQGVRLSELELIMGYIAPTELSSYRVYSPIGPGCSLAEVDLCYPAFKRAV
ncbi:MAG: integrase [Nitrosomonas sp.]|nr:integrase [Nitrosomonas sp.]